MKQAKGVTMRKFKGASIPAAQKAITYSEGKQAFTKGEHRSYNPYAANNLMLAAIWWNGWDTGEEESHTVQPAAGRLEKTIHGRRA